MEAGRELDALVAEKVMGLTYDRSQAETYGQYYTNVLNQTEVKNYSTDINAAWEVVEKMLENKYFREGFDLTVTEPPVVTEPTGWTCNFGDDNTRSYAETAPHAICVAAIKAKGFEHDLWVATQD